MNEKRIKTCPVCGKIFKMSDYASKQIYCSVKCKKSSPEYKEKQKEYNKLKRQEPDYYEKMKKYYSKDSYKEKRKQYESSDEYKKKKNDYRKKIQSTEEYKIKRREYKKEKRKNDIQYALRDKLRARIKEHLKLSNINKTTKSIDLLGCTIEDFKKHLESQFTDGMNWENMGFYGWHIDHIIPISKFDLTDIEEQKKAFNYKNTQPLWAKDNYQKKDKILNG